MTIEPAPQIDPAQKDRRIFDLCFEIHKFHRHGHLEKVYENALTHRLRKSGLSVTQQFPLVRDEDATIIGEYIADLFVDDCLIVEIKACGGLRDEHIANCSGTCDLLESSTDC